MKLKNVGFLSLHIEKIILAVVVLLSILIVWNYVLDNPYHVQLQASGESKQVSPREIEKVLDRAAEDLDSEISDTKNNPLPPLKIPDYTRMFREELTRRLVTGNAKLEAPMGWPGLGNEIFETKEPDKLVYFLPERPRPTDVNARAGFGVLALPENQQVGEDLIELVGNQQPRDFRYVSVSAEFDMEKWRSSLASPPPPGQGMMLPVAWWKDLLAITHVSMERRTLDPATGEWGPAEEIQRLPGQTSFGDVAKKWTPVEAQQVIREVLSHREQLARPAFVPLAGGPTWLPPNVNEDMSFEDQQRLMELERRIEMLRRQIQQQAAIAPAEREVRPGMRRPPRSGNSRNEMNALQRQLDEAIQRKNEIIGVDSAPADFAAVPQIEDVVTVWAHDVTAKPGQTYQYRLRVAVINPLFHRDLHESQWDFRDVLSIMSEPSPWSEPVHIESAYNYFITGANKGTKTVTAEVYTIFNGVRQMREFTISPGDSVGEVVSVEAGDDSYELDLRVGSLLVDVDFDVPISRGMMQSTVAKALLLDVSSASMQERRIDQDRNDEQRRRLYQEAQIANTAKTASASNP